eukprot:TRINITY_DN871_c0_g1_i2.p1 TRINITY_DN871_c0_g1~~TRINITY_DN871_c0_g1_i2.p1  ORF type:complete len:642 (-),score=165.42 TRINITY_DN871_c0_g1_i2:225-2150(-)
MLSEAELSKDITKILRADNPNAPKNITRFHFKEKQFKLDASVEQTEYHFSIESMLILKESEEGQTQLALEEVQRPKDDASTTGLPMGTVGEDAQHQEDDEKKGALRNQFNFSERASQTLHQPLKERAVQTEPPPVSDFSGTATQFDIFDAYVKDMEAQRREKEQQQSRGTKFGAKGGSSGTAGSAGSGAGGAGGSEKKKEDAKTAADEKHEDVVHSSAMARLLRFSERMVSQITYHDVALDFKYWEDTSDKYREEGTLLPLWGFRCDRTKKLRKSVTSLCWNPKYPDMFAVGYGSYDFQKQGPGMVACFTMKNPTYPEYMFMMEHGVMTVDFHPQHSSLLAVGLYDGTVMIFDVRQKVNRAIFQSTIKSGKHTDPVWQVCWQDEELAKNLNFFSVSSDGRVTNWTLSKNELQFTNVIELKLTDIDTHEMDTEASLVGLAGGCCFDFNRVTEHLFVVGTEEGKIHKCSKAYNSQYLETYEGHQMSIYAVQWNYFHPRVFISCSADWTVKVWEHNCKYPVMSFDLGNAVGCVAWAPYSSTVFAACTDDGKIYVFDLHQNKHEPICEQQIVKKSKLTKIAFNPQYPVLLVGDDRGNVSSLKLSPNLRKTSAELPEGKTPEDYELEKLQAILDVAEKAEFIESSS